MQQQEKVVLGVSLVVTLVGGWVQVGDAREVAPVRGPACYLIEKPVALCPYNNEDECREIAEDYGCNPLNLLRASCYTPGPSEVLRCEFSG